MIISDIIFGKNEIKIYETDNQISVNGVFLEGDFWYPRFAAEGADRIYISDSYHNVVKIYDSELKYAGEFGKEFLAEPSGMLYHDKKLYVCDTDNGIIRIFNRDGICISNFGPKFKKPSEIEYKNGIFYVNDINGHCITGIDSNGKVQLKIEKNLKYPSGIALSDNYIYIASEFSKEVRRYSYSGLYTGNIAEGSYYSKIKIKDEKAYLIDEEKNIVEEIELKENVFNEEEYLKNPLDKQEAAYFLFNKDKSKGVKYFSDLELWDKKRVLENEEIVQMLDGKKYYEFMAAYSSNKKKYSEILEDDKYYIELEKEINKATSDGLEKPKALCIKDDNIWTSLFNKKIITKLSSFGEIISFFTSEIQTEKLVYDNGKIYLIDYFYKKIYILDEESGEMKLFPTDIIKNPVDICKKGNNLLILDSETKKIVEINNNGNVINKIDVGGVEPVGFVNKKKYYVLDKRTGNVYIYSEDGTEEKVLLNNYNLKYPEGIAVDDNGYIYITDEGNNRVVKLDESGSFIYELGGFSMPKDIVYDNNKLYISNYAADNIKIYKVR